MFRRTMISALAGLFMAATATIASPAHAQQGGYNVDCTNGADIQNGVEIVVNMRPGYTYTATAIGINGFDPVLAVLDNTMSGLCADDVAEAAYYSAHLPTTGTVPSSTLSSQITFTHSTSGFSDISLVIGDYNGSGGEFVLIIEGMGVTAADGSGATAGDPFYVQITPSMINSGVPVTAYMISTTDTLDPLLKITDANDNALMVCDDAGTTSCEGQSVELSGYYVSQASGNLPGYGLDAMLQYALNGVRLNANATQNYLGFLMSSYNQSTYGQYVAAFHIGVR
jgi:hypothetical protein